MSTSRVFIPHEELVWVSGEVIKDVDSQGNIEVKFDDESLPNEYGTKLISLKKFGLPSLPQQNIEIPAGGVEDMTKLNYLHEPSILDNLKRRFKNSNPYTYTGEVCVAVNPYKWLPLYNDNLRAKYAKSTRHESTPHVYATSTDAYRGLTIRRKNQAILVTGESGAGKTETVKILMGHLAYIAGKANDKTVDKLLKANPLLESFGNAKTARNDNSSRFGKFSQMEFNDSHQLVGSKCVTYLLEKHRVVSQTKLDRNFHIMYQLLAAPDVVKTQLHLANKKVLHFNYLNGGDIKTSVIEGKSDGDHYMATAEGLQLLGVGPQLRGLMEQALAGILHMGQIAFHTVQGNADASTITQADGKFDSSTLACCEVLGVNVSTFSSSVVSRFIEVEGKKLPVPLSVEQAASGRDALSKEIYSRIFQWLIYVINFETSYSCNVTEEVRRAATVRSGGCSTISLLDIFGFECFAVNGFEQFCINFANEKLQQRFTQDVFMTVQKEYQEEGLPWEIIRYKDNQETLDMIEGRLGIIDLLNEECLIPKGTDGNFLTKIKQSFQSHYAFSSEQRQTSMFTVRHYAGQVTYTVNHFMDSNKDTIPNNLVSMLSESSNMLLKRLFSEQGYFNAQTDPDSILQEDKSFIGNLLLLNIDTESEYSNIPVTDPSNASMKGFISMKDIPDKKKGGGYVVSEKILTKFKNQLANLMEMVNSTDVQYVRCIKPNANKSSTEYDRRMVVEQLRSAGMIEAVRISRAAYPNRLSYNDFSSRFQILQTKVWRHETISNSKMPTSSSDESYKNMAITKGLLMHIIPDNKKEIVDGTGTTTHYAFGHTKVYFTSHVLEKLEAARNNAITISIINIQKTIRRFVKRKQYKRIIAAIRAEEARKKKLEEEARLAELRAQNPDDIPSPPPSVSAVQVQGVVPVIKPPLPAVTPATSTSSSSYPTSTSQDHEQKLHPHVSLTRNHEPVLHTSYLGTPGVDGNAPITITVDQEVEGKIKIMISKKYPKSTSILTQ